MVSYARTVGVIGFALAAPAVSRATTQTNPLAKVVEMLEGMMEKGKAEKHTEEVEFATFKVWCDDTRGETAEAIKHAKNAITQLEADIEKAEADAELLAEQVEDLQGSVAKETSELQKATSVREKEAEDYSVAHKDYSDSIDAVEHALTVLKSGKGSAASLAQVNSPAAVAASLLQVTSAMGVSARTRAVIESFMDIRSLDDDAVQAEPEPAVYENQSGGVMDLLDKLRLKFQDERFALEKEEITSKSNFEVLKQRLVANTEEDEATISEKTATKAGRIEDAETAKGDLEIKKTGKAEDENKLGDAKAECTLRSEEFEKNQVLRSAEVKAIAEALKILGSDAVAGSAEKHLPTMLLQRRTSRTRSALSQLRSVSPRDAGARDRAVAFLKSRAQLTGSRYLALIAARASSDPFVKVKKMIKDLIVKLMEEANQEADHKGFCDAELATNKQTRGNRADEVETLTAAIETSTADIAQLTQDLQRLAEEMATIAEEQSSSTKMRNEEKAKNGATITDAKEAQLAVERATQVLKDYYAKAQEGSAAFLQSLEQNGDSEGLDEEMQQTAREPYHGNQEGGGSIIGFLEVVLSDFARLEAQTSSAEDEAQTTFETFINEAKEDVAVKQTESGHKTAKKEAIEESVHSMKKQLKLTQVELDKALEYYEKLKPDCVDAGLSFQDRVAMRKAEIESLQGALKILSGEELE